MTQVQTLLSYAAWGVAHEPSFHYAQTRPIPYQQFKDKTLPLTTDCSGFVTCCYYAAGYPDPNGLGYNGQGFTGTLLEHGTKIELRSCKVGDLVLFGSGTGDHVCMVIAANAPNPLLVSHGQEAGPINIHFLEEKAFHAGEPWQVRRYFAAPAKPSWTVRAGDGTVIGKKVQRPALWAMTHWKKFRKYGKLTFDRD